MIRRSMQKMIAIKCRIASYPLLWVHASKLIRFGVVGLGSGCVFFAFTHYFVSYLSIDPKAAAIFGYCAAIPFNFFANRLFSFRSSGDVLSEIVRFLIMHGIGVAVTYGIMVIFVDMLSWSHLLPAVFAVFFVSVINFFILNSWVFTKQHR